MTRSKCRALIIAAVLTLAGCVDGPFAHVNPHDPATSLTLTIRGGTDTLRVAGDFVLFQAVTDPVTTGATVFWESSDQTRLAPQGNGLFLVGVLPLTPTGVEVRARLGAASATRTVVILPAGAP